MSHSELASILVGIGAAGAYGVYKICNSVLSYARSYSPRTTHSKFGNPIHVIEDQGHYNWAIEELDREITTAERPLLGFVCRWKQEVRTGKMIFTELQLARPNGICILVDLNKMRVPQKLRELLSKSTVVGVDVLSGILFLEEKFDTTVRDYMDMRDIPSSLFSMEDFIKQMLKIDVSCSFYDNVEHGYTDRMIQSITSNSIGVVKAVAEKYSVLRKTFKSGELWPVYNEMHLSDRFFAIHVASDRYSCRYIAERLHRELSSGSNKYSYLGFDCRWIEDKKQRKPVALLQLARPDGGCYLIRLCLLPLMEIPKELKILLIDSKVLKVGVNAMQNAVLLEKDYKIRVRGVVDLRHFQPFPPNDLVYLVHQNLNFELYEDKNINASNWEQANLTPEQIQHAAGYAIAGVTLFEKFYHKHAARIEAIIDREYDENILIHHISNYISESAIKTATPDIALFEPPPLITSKQKPKPKMRKNFSNEAIPIQLTYHIHVVSDENHCRWIVGKLSYQRQKLSYLGFDCEWLEYKKLRNPVALLQLADPDGICALIRLCMISMPDELRSLLEDPKILKVGVGSIRDGKLLEADYEVRVRGVVDLRHFQPIPPNGLAVLAQQELNVELGKDKRISASNWEQSNLTKDQIQYASSDAITGLQIFESFYKKQAACLDGIVDKEYNPNLARM